MLDGQCRSGLLITALLTVAIAGAAGCSDRGGASSMPGMSYDSLKELPDLSGWWMAPVDFNANARSSILGPPPPLKPVYAMKVQQFLQKLYAGVDPADLSFSLKERDCVRPLFAGGLQVLGYSDNDGVVGAFEILSTPGRVTITNEYGLIRRIQLNRGPLPADLEESSAGTSIGHWEAKTLVIETGGIDHTTEVVPGVPVGRNVRVVERMTLREPDVLEIETRVTAPEILTTSEVTAKFFHRDRGHRFQELRNCVKNDRSVDAAGRQRFDLTPPPGLPPPPAD
jgi:hypothetical protein